MADGMFGSIASGAASGAGMGAQLGSIVPGIGTAAGAIGGALIGGISAGQKQKASNQAQMIPMVDPMERARLAELNQTRRSISAGSDVLTQQNIQQQRNIGKAAQNAIARSTGGDVGSTIDALLKSQKATQGGINQSIAQSANRLPYFDSAAGNLTSRIAQRKLELSRLRRDQRVAEAAQGRTDANINTQALLATQGGTQTIPEGVQSLIPTLRGVFAGQGNAQPSQSIPTPIGATAPGMVTPDPSTGQIIGAQSNIPLGTFPG